MTAQRAPNPSPSPLSSNRPNNPTPECCMCGDFGFSSELFQCQVCQFRSQHRYCGNLYPKAESYKACNWCLLQRDDSKDKSQNSSNSSSSNHNKGKDQSGTKITTDNNRRKVSDLGLMVKTKDARSNDSRWQSIIDGPIKKKKSPERSPVATTLTITRRRLIRNGQLEEKLRRTKSDVMASNHNNNNNKSSSNSNSIGNERRQVIFRSKVRRYKLLDEVSS